MCLADLCKEFVHLLGVHFRADLPVEAQALSLQQSAIDYPEDA
jgi:hypothetical protein